MLLDYENQMMEMEGVQTLYWYSTRSTMIDSSPVDQMNSIA